MKVSNIIPNGERVCCVRCGITLLKVLSVPSFDKVYQEIVYRCKRCHDSVQCLTGATHIDIEFDVLD